MADKILYAIFVVIGAIVWLLFSLWFLKRSFKKYSPSVQIQKKV